MARGESWSSAEDGSVMEFYVEHGPNWPGWAEVLPDRTPRAIQARAQRLGVAVDPRRRREHVRAASPDWSAEEERDPREDMVQRRMHEGASPSEIDAEMHWRPGTARRIIVWAWGRDKGETYERGYEDCEAFGRPLLWA
jgi:hypothetical protein